jgi:CRP/FNR family transcriptional regulator, anaerobic regulatory protein
MELTRTTCADCQLRTRCIWRNVPEVPGIEVAPRLYRRAGAVYRAGDKTDGIYVVRSGSVKTYWIGSDGAEQVLGFHGPGSVFGVEALGKGVHVHYADSLETSTVCVLPTTDLTRACASSPDAVVALLQALGDFAKDNERTQVWLGARNAEQRLASFLLETAEHQRARGFSAQDLQLPMPRRDIAKHLAVAVETLSRLFAKLEASGTVHVDPGDRRRIRISSLDTLSALAAPATAALQ